MSPGKAINMTMSGLIGVAIRRRAPHTAPMMTPEGTKTKDEIKKRNKKEDLSSLYSLSEGTHIWSRSNCDKLEVGNIINHYELSAIQDTIVK